jgi:guanyl-specific ribonuclease Sa
MRVGTRLDWALLRATRRSSITSLSVINAQTPQQASKASNQVIMIRALSVVALPTSGNTSIVSVHPSNRSIAVLTCSTLSVLC